MDEGVKAELKCWDNMRQRCYNPNDPSYPYYGGRGIKVCARWRESFRAFLSDMGLRPSPKHSIDRINNDGNYEPGNCQWATKPEQAGNRSLPGPRATSISEGRRITQTLAEARKAAGLTQNQLADIIGITQSTLADIERGRRKLPHHRIGKLPPAIRRKVIDAAIAELKALR